MTQLPKTLKLSKRKQAYRDSELSECVYKPLKDGQVFKGGKKVVLLYASNKVAEDGYVDAEWIARVEIHHLVQGEKCHAFYTDRLHDGMIFEDAWNDLFLSGTRPGVQSIRIQRDGAVQLVIWEDFSFHSYQAFELRGLS